MLCLHRERDTSPAPEHDFLELSQERTQDAQEQAGRDAASLPVLLKRTEGYVPTEVAGKRDRCSMTTSQRAF